MLKNLFIKNYAIIEHLEIQWSAGLTVITGETGAGKSILMGALQLVFGARADSKILRKSDEKCVVEVLVSCPLTFKSEIQSFLDEDIGEELLIRREILPTGKSRSFINDSPVLVSVIQSIRHHLIGIHQQFDHLDFLDKEYQLAVLDNYAGQVKRVKEYEIKFKQFQDKLSDRNQIMENNAKALLEKEFIEFQCTELNKASIKSGELELLEMEINASTKIEEIKKNTEQAYQILDAENGVLDQLQVILNNLKAVQVNSSVKELYQRIEQNRTDLKDSLFELESLSELSEIDPIKITSLHARLDQLNRLLKKHNVQKEDDLLQLQLEFQHKLQLFDHSKETLIQLDQELDQLKYELGISANKLSSQRRIKAPDLIKNTILLLKRMGLENAQFDIEISTEPSITINGLDRIQFLFSANKGSNLKPLKDQVSGGELARFNLAIKAQVAQQSQLNTLVFDEIDTGVSGQIALEMGNVLKETAKNCQVICITHSAQVASRADAHYYVYKENSDTNTLTQIKILNKDEKLIELATMLSGEPPGPAAIKNAKDLLTR